MEELESYWSNRYREGNTGWDLGACSSPLKAYFEQIENRDKKILIPGAGNAYEAEYLFQNGFKNIYVLDVSIWPLQALKKRLPSFPEENLLHKDFFNFEGQFDLIIEQTFFCSFEPSKENRENYFKKMAALLKPGAKLVGLWFKHPLSKESNRPFGGSQEEYEGYIKPYLEIIRFEECYNSIKPRMGNELFGIFKKTIK